MFTLQLSSPRHKRALDANPQTLKQAILVAKDYFRNCHHNSTDHSIQIFDNGRLVSTVKWALVAETSV